MGLMGPPANAVTPALFGTPEQWEGIRGIPSSILSPKGVYKPQLSREERMALPLLTPNSVNHVEAYFEVTIIITSTGFFFEELEEFTMAAQCSNLWLVRNRDNSTQQYGN
jgi:hypothetical protein